MSYYLLPKNVARMTLQSTSIMFASSIHEQVVLDRSTESVTGICGKLYVHKAI